MLKPICVPCRRFYRPKKSGFYFVEGMPAPGGPRRPAPGTAEPDAWAPYKLWSGDLYRCEGCGAEAIVGTGARPIAEHYEPDFAEHVDRLGADIQINDC